MDQYDKLRELLTKEQFPLLFTFKFIGKNSRPFEQGVQFFETKSPTLTKQSQRYSQNQKHISMTYTFNANSPDEIIGIFDSISKIPDISVIL